MNVKYCLCLLLACFLFCLLCNPLALYFLSDDFDSMFMAQTWSGVIHSYRPGSDFLLHTDHLLYNYNASGYHITNYLLHFLTVFMLFFTTRQLLQPFYSPKTVEQYAFVASLIFLFYPFHSECIFWLVGRSSLLAALFAMASIYCYLRKKAGISWYILSLVCLILGLFSYESIWTLPAFIIILSLIYDKGTTLKYKLLYAGGYWLVFFIYLVARFYLTTTFIGSPYGTQKIVSLNILLLLRNLASLLSRSFVPPMQSSIWFVICLCIMVLMIAVVLFKIKGQITTPIVVTTIAFLLCLLPVISLGIDTHDTESERFLYMPSTFLSILFSIVLHTLFKNKTAYAIGVLLAAQIVFLSISYRSFVAASKVTKATAQGLSSLQQTHIIYCINLPGQYKGGFIFRNGIANAANLFAPQVKEVNIVSQSVLSNYPNNYRLDFYPLNNLPGSLKKMLALKSASQTAVLVWDMRSLNVYR